MTTKTNGQQSAGMVHEYEGEQWQLQELVDEVIVQGGHSQYMRSEYMWEFSVSGKIVRGLTSSMYAHMALLEGISIDHELTTFEETDDGWLDCHVIAKRTNPLTGAVDTAEGFGSRQIPKPADGKWSFDAIQTRKFLKQTVWSIAARNARKQLIPFDKVVFTINALATAKPGTVPGDLGYGKQQQAQPKSQEALPAASTNGNGNGNGEQSGAMKRCMDLYNQHAKTLPSNFWDLVQGKFSVASSSEMSDAQWFNVISLLNRWHKVPDDAVERNEAIKGWQKDGVDDVVVEEEVVDEAEVVDANGGGDSSAEDDGLF